MLKWVLALIPPQWEKVTIKLESISKALKMNNGGERKSTRMGKQMCM